MARRDRNSIRKERLIMLASSVFVLTALTVTGVYVNKNNKEEQEDYVVDFEALEEQNTQTAENMMSGEELDTLFAEVGTDDLDYDPSFQEANSQKVENTEEEKEKKKEYWKPCRNKVGLVVCSPSAFSGPAGPGDAGMGGVQFGAGLWPGPLILFGVFLLGTSISYP